ILTGEPPHRASSQEEIKLRAMLGEMERCFARLDRCGADAELIGIAKRCLAPAQSDRPREAGAVAEAVTAYLAGVQEKLHKAEVERAAAETRAAEERKRRHVRLGLAAAVLALVIFGGSVGLWWWQQHSDMLRDVESALAEAADHRDAGRWPDVQRAL